MNTQNSTIAEKKIRHAFVNVWLVLMIIFYLLGSIAMVTSSSPDVGFGSGTPDISILMAWLIAIIGLVNAFGAFLILKGRKIGFYIIGVLAIFSFAINLVAGLGLFDSSVAVIALLVLNSVLLLKNKEDLSAWDLLD